MKVLCHLISSLNFEPLCVRSAWAERRNLCKPGRMVKEPSVLWGYRPCRPAGCGVRADQITAAFLLRVWRQKCPHHRPPSPLSVCRGVLWLLSRLQLSDNIFKVFADSGCLMWRCCLCHVWLFLKRNMILPSFPFNAVNALKSWPAWETVRWPDFILTVWQWRISLRKITFKILLTPAVPHPTPWEGWSWATEGKKTRPTFWPFILKSEGEKKRGLGLNLEGHRTTRGLRRTFGPQDWHRKLTHTDKMDRKEQTFDFKIKEIWNELTKTWSLNSKYGFITTVVSTHSDNIAKYESTSYLLLPGCC